MSADKRVPARSDEEVRRITERTKDDYGASRRRPVNILRYLESGAVLTIYGRKKLTFDDATGCGVVAAAVCLPSRTAFASSAIFLTRSAA